MTDQQTMPATGYPTTPPLELLKHWQDQWFDGNENLDVLLIQAFQAGADQELEACCAWLVEEGAWPEEVANLRTARRPKPPSQAEQAIAELDEAVMRGDCITTTDAMPSLRAALKRLAELEAAQ